MNNSFALLFMDYDDSGALKEEQMSLAGVQSTVTYRPDQDGHVQDVVYPHGDIARTQTDFLGRVASLQFAYGSAPTGFYLMAAYGYTNGRLTNRSTNYNVASVYLYQANGRVVAVDHANASARLSHETYGYYGNGQLSWFVRNGDAATNVLNNGTGDAYGYQADGQLNSMGYHITNPYSSTNFDGDNPSAEVWNHPSREDAYGYDAAGNRTVDNEGGAYVAPGFDAENRQSGTGYDANGNCTVAGYRGSTYTYVYDAQNQLMGASGGGNSLSFGYDPKGRLVQRTINGVTTRLHYAGVVVINHLLTVRGSE